MIPLTLASGRFVELQYIMDATLLYCALVARSCPVIRIERYRSGTNLYKGHAVNFLQDFNYFLVLLGSQDKPKLRLMMF